MPKLFGCYKRIFCIQQVVPGIGWDNLRNIETGLITKFTYAKCQYTYDRKYLIPDNTFAVPQKASIIEQNAEIIDHWDSYVSTTSRSINVGLDILGKIGGKFSAEYRRVKSSQYRDDSFTTKIELRHRFYTITQLPDSLLHPGFKRRLLEIASYLKTNDYLSANFLAEILIRDYGTHFLSSVDAGAVLVKEDSIRRTEKSRESTKSYGVAAAAAADFFGKVGLNAGSNIAGGEEVLNGYRHNRTSSKIFSYGGPPYRLGMTAEEWENDLANNLVAVDRTGKPLFSLITSLSMQPEIFDPREIQELRLLIQNVIAQYYGFNTHIGCTKPNAPNFDYQANTQTPGSCLEVGANYTFGGVFQKCTSTGGNMLCEKLMQKNPLTGDFSCPADFEAILLYNGEMKQPRRDKSCKNKQKCVLGFIKCRNIEECTYTSYTEVASYYTFWCTPSHRDLNRGYLFGGLYSNDIKNAITRSQTCPTHYTVLKFGSHARVCVSEDYELGREFSLPFGGFFSCKAGNYLASNNASSFLNNPSNWPMRCPPGFTQHLAMVESNCRINFCVKAGSLLKHTDLEIVLPPFEPKPAVKSDATGQIYTMLRFSPPANNSNVTLGMFQSSSGDDTQKPHFIMMLVGLCIAIIAAFTT